MKQINKDIWVGVDDKNNDPEFLETVNSEFTELPIIDSLSKESSVELKSNRRDFLRYLGFGLGAATLAAGCDTPVRRAIPYVVKPDAIVPGVANYYASSFVRGGDYCSVLVKTREGRPILVEGNKLSPVSKGGTSARAQASVLDLYDTNRVRSGGKVVDGMVDSMSWEDLDKAIKDKLSANAQIRIVSNTCMIPAVKRAFAEFKAKYPNAEWVTYDPFSSSAILQANEQSFGQKAIPDYHFINAQVIVAFDADFLGTWISPTEYSCGYTTNRIVDDYKNPKMSRHYQVESGMSFTGSNADHRILVKPSEQGAAIAALYNAVAKLAGASTVSAPGVNEKAAKAIRIMADDLWENRNKALVIAGSNNIGEQILINKINDMLGSYGHTIDFAHVSYQKQGIDSDIRNLIREMNAGSVDALFVYDANPAYDLPNTNAFVEGMAKVGLKVALNPQINETAALCDYMAPDHHYLESWNDVEVKRGQYGMIQPTISPLFNTRQVGESFLRWADSSALDVKAEQPYYEFLKAGWEAEIFPKQSEFLTFQSFWDNVLHDGIFSLKVAPNPGGNCQASASDAASRINKPGNAPFEISFYETISMGSGQYAGNPWLQELPDPVTRCVWGNYLGVPVEWDGIRNIEGIKGIGRLNKKSTADYVNITVDGGEPTRVTAIPQFGQMAGTMAIGLGYGRTVVSKTGVDIGVDLFPNLTYDANGNVIYYSANADLSEVQGYEEEFACVQYHHTMGVKGLDTEVDEVINVDEKNLGYKGYQGSLTSRSVIRQTNLDDLQEYVQEMDKEKKTFNKLNSHTLYPFDEYKENVYGQGHHWGLYIDLNACTGCGACVVACNAENNVPVVGKLEVHRHHEMSWLRIDRYYYGDFENPNVVYQPMMCQHCDNAPCENVCPVAATNHSSEGLNQMTYNRCIGTRYCANNCPYKVRRFNWLDYTTADLFPGNQPHVNEEEVPFGADNLTRMVLNPDVTVRSRGVIEKCSFCVQRIQEGKLTAKREGRRLNDNDINSACSTSCPTGGIAFGDLNDKNSLVSRKIANAKLGYRALEEINVQSSVVYSAKITNRNSKLDAEMKANS
ncbi:MAG: TAT-variant-translocated molybdopterin oxidoreductase [Bacteroidota bacterium]